MGAGALGSQCFCHVGGRMDAKRRQLEEKLGFQLREAAHTACQATRRHRAVHRSGCTGSLAKNAKFAKTSRVPSPLFGSSTTLGDPGARGAKKRERRIQLDQGFHPLQLANSAEDLLFTCCDRLRGPQTLRCTQLPLGERVSPGSEVSMEPNYGAESVTPTLSTHGTPVLSL